MILNRFQKWPLQESGDDRRAPVCRVLLGALHRQDVADVAEPRQSEHDPRRKRGHPGEQGAVLRRVDRLEQHHEIPAARHVAPEQ